PEFAFQAKEAGFDLAYFQFDGVTNDGNSHRHITNLFDVKQKAIDVMYAAGIDIIPVTTVVNTVNSDQVGPILDFVIKNCDKMGGVSFQPVSFTGRDEEISDEDRHRQRYTISHMAQDLLRSLQGPEGPNFGSLSCSCHPNCGASLLLVANRKTKDWASLTQFFDIEQCMKDFALICDTARGRELTVAQVVLCFMRNFDGAKAPKGLDLNEFIKLFYNGKLGGTLGQKQREKDWT